MSKSFKLCLFALGFLAATGLHAVQAAEGFLCDGGKIVYVKVADLERMKRTHPCIARYFGVTVESAAVEAVAQPAASSRSAKPHEAPSSAPVKLRPLRDPEVTHRAATAKTRVAGPPPPPRASEGTDFRNVPLLNAGSGEEAIFRHER